MSIIDWGLLPFVCQPTPAPNLAIMASTLELERASGRSRYITIFPQA
jgi:hypothetical protein